MNEISQSPASASTAPATDAATTAASASAGMPSLTRAQRKAIAWQGKNCENCEIPLLGPFCHCCGQPERTPIRDLLALSNDALDYLFDVDARVWRTLVSLFFAPGRLTQAYLAGRRMSFIRPLRVYLVMSALLFLVVNWTSDLNMQVKDQGDVQIIGTTEKAAPATQAVPPASKDIDLTFGATEATQNTQDAAGAEPAATKPPVAQTDSPPESKKKPVTLRLFGKQPWHRQSNPLVIDWLSESSNNWINDQIGVIQSNLGLVRDEPRRLAHAFLQVLPQSLFVLLPIFALLLKLILVFKRRLYMEHLMVAVHSHTFIYMGIIAAVCLSKIAEFWPVGWFNPWWFLMGLCIVWIPLNLFLTQKRVYRQRWWGAAMAFFVIGSLYLILVSFTALAALVMSLVNL